MNYRSNYRSQGRDRGPRNDPKPISGVVRNVLASLGLARRYDGWLTVTNWPEMVGEQVAKVARAVRFEDGVLYVAVAGDVWRQELSMQTDAILKKIRSYPYGKVVTQLRLVRGEKGQ